MKKRFLSLILLSISYTYAQDLDERAHLALLNARRAIDEVRDRESKSKSVRFKIAATNSIRSIADSSVCTWVREHHYLTFGIPFSVWGLHSYPKSTICLGGAIGLGWVLKHGCAVLPLYDFIRDELANTVIKHKDEALNLVQGNRWLLSLVLEYYDAREKRIGDIPAVEEYLAAERVRLYITTMCLFLFKLKQYNIKSSIPIS